jgi:hypothetical protein
VSDGTTRMTIGCTAIAGRGWTCTVTLVDATGSSTHQVLVAAAALERFAPGAAEPDALVRASFEFLLAREGRASILRRFELPLIERYFPEYPDAIGRSIT